MKLNIEECITLNQIHERFGKGFSKSSIRRMIKSGLLIEGSHYLRTNGGIIRVSPTALRKKFR